MIVPHRSAIMGDLILFAWLTLAVLWDIAIFGATGYLVFWRGHSGWWFVIATISCHHTSLYAALRERFGVPKEKSAK